MDALLFPNFLTDANEYQQAENLLVDLWKDVESVSVCQEDTWVYPWLNTIAVDGTPLRDGDPIFSAWCPAQKRAIRVVLHESWDGGKAGISYASMTRFGPGCEDIQVLEVFMAPTQETIIHLSLWLLIARNKATPNYMETVSYSWPLGIPRVNRGSVWLPKSEETSDVSTA